MATITAVQDKIKGIYIIRYQYNPDINVLIKKVPGHHWNPTKKFWTIPNARLGFFLAQLRGTPYEDQIDVYSDERIDENATLDPTFKIPEVDLTGIPFYVGEGCKVFPHQLDFMRYAIDRQRRGLKNGFILGDSPGMTKTCQAMNLALYNRKFKGIKHCLVIVCLNSAKFNWVEDIKKHTNGEEVPYLLGMRKKKRVGGIRYSGSSEEKLQDLICGHMYGDENEPELPFFLVLNIEAFHYKTHNRYDIRERIGNLINSGYIGMVIIDEVHKNCSGSSTSGKQLIKLKQQIKTPIEWLPMTGTPIVNKPTDVFVPLYLVGGHNCTSYYQWCQYFCVYGGFGGHDIITYKHIPELKRMLQANMLRRVKANTLDLPEKIHSVEYVENTTYQAKLYDKVRTTMIAHQDEIMTLINPAVKFLQLRQVSGSPELVDTELKVDRSYLNKNAKLQRLLDLVNTIILNDEKVIIYSNWVAPLRTIYRFLATEYKVCCYTGTMDQDVREQHKQTFLTNPQYKIMLGTIDALGVSHNLPVANNIIFYDLPWNPATMEQAEDRAHRPGLVGTLNIYSLIAKDTVDELVYDMIMQKGSVSKYIVDNELDFKNNPQLFMYLVTHIFASK